MVTCHMMPISVATALKAAGDCFGLGSGVCVLKEAATQIRDGERFEVRFEVRSADKLEGAFYTMHDAEGYAAELRGGGATDVTVVPMCVGHARGNPATDACDTRELFDDDEVHGLPVAGESESRK